MARQQRAANEPTQFEPGIVRGSDVRVVAESQRPEILDEPKKLPPAIMLTESIGWMENNILCSFREDQMVTNPEDIKRLLQHGAQYMVVTRS